MPSVFITGTDTDIGKTIVSSWIVHHWQADYWKPIQSGLAECDSDTVTQLARLPSSRLHPETYRLEQPLSPHASAAIDGVQIELDQFKRPTTNRPLVVEGAGGTLVPLNDSKFVIDLIAQLAVPVIIVARSGLGTLNHTLLTLEALRAREIDTGGVIMCGPANESNRLAIEHYGQTRVLAELSYFDSLTPAALAQTPLPTPLRTYLEGLHE